MNTFNKNELPIMKINHKQIGFYN